MSFDDFLDEERLADPQAEVERLKRKYNMFRQAVQDVSDEEPVNEHLQFLLCDQRFEEEP